MSNLAQVSDWLRPGMLERVLISIAGGIALSLLVFKLGDSADPGWRVVPELPGFFVAMFTPGFGVHGDIKAFDRLMLTANGVFYVLVVFAYYPLFVRRKK